MNIYFHPGSVYSPLDISSATSIRSLKTSATNIDALLCILARTIQLTVQAVICTM